MKKIPFEHKDMTYTIITLGDVVTSGISLRKIRWMIITGKVLGKVKYIRNEITGAETFWDKRGPIAKGDKGFVKVKPSVSLSEKVKRAWYKRFKVINKV